MAWSPFVPLMCCINLDKSLNLSKPLLFHQQNGKRTVPHQFTDGHKTCGGKQQAHPSGHYRHPNWHSHMELRASNWDFLWARESGSPWQDPECHQGALRAAGAVVGLGSPPRTPCQPPPALSSACSSALLPLATRFPGWMDTRLIWFSLDANPSEWGEGARWSCTMQISWVTGWYLPEAVQVGKDACMSGQGWGIQTHKNISEAENKSEYIGIYKHWLPTPQQL